MAESHFNYDNLERGGRFTSATFSIIFIDIVRFTSFGDNSALREAVRALRDCIVDVLEKLHWDEPAGTDNDCIMLPTGDGYGIAFETWISDVEILRYAVDLSTRLKQKGYPIRLGISKGPCFVYKVLNDHLNLVGWGIVDAERAMSAGTRNHILCTYEFARPCLDMKSDPDLYDIGEFEVKERKVHLYSYYSEGKFGNKEMPRVPRPKRPAKKRRKSARGRSK